MGVLYIDVECPLRILEGNNGEREDFIMKLSKSMDQVFCIMTMLYTQKVDVPISSVTIHHRLRDSSSSYISKILRKLVVSGLINSVSGNNGGFTLAKDPEEINLLDIVEAVEGKIDTYPDSDLIHTVFSDYHEFAESGIHTITSAFRNADKEYANYLYSQKLSVLVEQVIGKERTTIIDWNEA